MCTARNGWRGPTAAQPGAVATLLSREMSSNAYQKHEHALTIARCIACACCSLCAHHKYRLPCSIAHNAAMHTTRHTTGLTPDAGGGCNNHTCHCASCLPAGKPRCSCCLTACATGQSQNACCLCRVDCLLRICAWVSWYPHTHCPLWQIPCPPAPCTPLTASRHNTSLNWLSHGMRHRRGKPAMKEVQRCCWTSAVNPLSASACRAYAAWAARRATS